VVDCCNATQAVGQGSAKVVRLGAPFPPEPLQ
jgi:hypothetical protein